MIVARRIQFTDQLLLFGDGAAKQPLGEELHARGWKRVALFTSSSTSVEPPIGISIAATFASIRDHAPILDTERIADELANVDLDCLLTIGGGKVTDTAKGVATLLAEGGRFEDHCNTISPNGQFAASTAVLPKLPIVAIATTLSGAELTPGAGGTNDKRIKRVLWDANLAARLAVYDPQVMRQTSRSVLLASAFNALHHCAEGLYSPTSTPVSDALALEGTKRLAQGLRALMSAKEEPAFEALTQGAALAGMTLATARTGVGHAICHVVGARFGVPHGDANAIVMPAVLRFNLPVTQEAQARFKTALGAEPEAFRDEVGAPSRLREYGITREQLPIIAEELKLERGYYSNPRPIRSDEEALELLASIW